ncbi:MAG: DNA translocase FtsK 4TM domain-containing protein, partial [Burkholderiales bacterium]
MGVASKTGTPLPARLAGLLREAKWLLLIAAATYLFLIFATFQRSDPGWSHSATAAATRNAGGAVGAWLADVLLYLFGVSAYWWVALCLYVVVWGYRRMERLRLAIAAGGFLLLLLSSAALERLRFHSLNAELPLAPGGLMGEVTTGALSGALGFTGATLALLTLAAIGFSLFLGVSWLTIFEGVGGCLEKAYAMALGAWERRRDRKLGSLAREEREAVVQIEKRREEEHPPLRIEPPLAEIKKS